MREFVCFEDRSWLGILAALAQARSGDVVRLSPGRYAGVETLFIPSGVTLAGERGVVLRFEADAPAVRFRELESGSLTEVVIEAASPCVARRSFPDDPASTEDIQIHWGLIYVEHSRNVRLSSVEIIASPGDHQHLNAIALWSSNNCVVSDCRIGSVGGDGILLTSSDALIHRNHVSGMRYGIVLNRSSNAPNQPSRARLERNRCHDNAQSGIVLVSSEAEAIADNECWGNQGVGIFLQRSQYSPDQPSRAHLESNRCYDNAQSGIVLSSCEAEAIADNECWSNQEGGIILSRDPYSPDQPSRAHLESNRCYDNAQSGILLSSSEAEAIADNECWGNKGGGIVLQRDARSPDQPARARLHRNRCHDNAGGGIVLFSSEAEAIADNESWGNQGVGIHLQRDSDSPDQPSRAHLERNRCHDNAGGGIVLSSSEAEAIADNECWGNKGGGIVLQRGARSPDRPSRAHLERNRCYDNAGGGIFLSSSEAEAIADNECWSNQKGGIVLERDPRSPEQPSQARVVGNVCDHNGGAGFNLLSATVIEFHGNRVWENRDGSLIPNPADTALRIPWTPPQTALATTNDPHVSERRRLLSRSGALEDRLEKIGCTDPDALARFIAGPGCAGCLQAAWRSRPVAHSRLPLAGREEGPQAGRLYRLVSEVRSDTVVFEKGGRASLTDQIWRFARHTASAKAGSVKIVGVLGGKRRDLLGALTRDIQLVRGAERDREHELIDQSELCHAAFKSFGRQDRRIGRLLDVDCSPRVALAMAGVTKPLSPPIFQKETLGVTPRWNARLPLLLRPSPILLGALVLVSFPLGLAAFGRWRGFGGDFRNVLGAAWYYLGVMAAGSHPKDWPALFGMVCFVPASLAYIANLFLPDVLRLQLPKMMENYARRFIGLDHWLQARSDHKSALRWVGRRLFGVGLDQGFALLVIRNPDLWHPDDLDRLRALVQSRPAWQGLAVVVPLRGGSQVASGLLSPWVNLANRLPRPDMEAEIELLILPEDSEQALDLLPTANPLVLLGIEASENAPKQTVYRSLCDDRLTIYDFIPLLVFGSTSECPFFIAYDEQNSEPALDEVIAPYIQFVADAPAGKSTSIQPTAVEPLILRSPCSLLHVERVGKRSRRRLIGREGFRNELSAALRPIFSEQLCDFDGYARVLAGCGQLFNLLETVRLLDNDGLTPDNIVRIAGHLRATVALRKASPPFPEGSHRLVTLVQAWTELIEKLSVIRVSKDNFVRADLVEIVILAFGAAAPNADLGDAHLLSALERPQGLSAKNERLQALQEVFTEEVGRVLSTFSELDAGYANNLLQHQFASSWQFMPAAVRAGVFQRIKAQREAIPALPERLAQAATYDQFGLLLQAHRGDLPRFMALCYCLAARNATDLHQQQRLAQIISRHCTTGLKISSAIEISFPQCSSTIIDYLADQRTEELIRPVARAAEPDYYERDHFYLGSFDSVSAEVQNIIELRFAGGSKQAPLDHSPMSLPTVREDPSAT